MLQEKWNGTTRERKSKTKQKHKKLSKGKKRARLSVFRQQYSRKVEEIDGAGVATKCERGGQVSNHFIIGKTDHRVESFSRGLWLVAGKERADERVTNIRERGVT